MGEHFLAALLTLLLASGPANGVMLLDTGWSPRTCPIRTAVISAVFDLRCLRRLSVPSYRAGAAHADQFSLLDLNETIEPAWRAAWGEHTTVVAQAFAQTDSSVMRDRKVIAALDPLAFFLLAATSRDGFATMAEADELLGAYVTRLIELITEGRHRVVVRSLGGRFDIDEDTCRTLVRRS